MRITTRITWDMATWEVLEHEYFEHSGTVELAKGEGHAQDQLNLQNQLVQQQLAWQKQFQQPVMDSLGKYLNGNIGFTPEQMALLNSSFLNNTSQDFNSANEQIKSALASRGEGTGDLPVSPDYTNSLASLYGLKASTTATGLRDIQLQNIQQALANKFNAANIFMGNAGIVGNNVGTFNAGAGNALDDYIKAANSGPLTSFLGAFGGGLGSALGSGFGKGITGGFSNMFSGSGGGGMPPPPPGAPI